MKYYQKQHIVKNIQKRNICCLKLGSVTQIFLFLMFCTMGVVGLITRRHVVQSLTPQPKLYRYSYLGCSNFLYSPTSLQ